MLVLVNVHVPEHLDVVVPGAFMFRCTSTSTSTWESGRFCLASLRVKPVQNEVVSTPTASPPSVTCSKVRFGIDTQSRFRSVGSEAMHTLSGDSRR